MPENNRPPAHRRRKGVEMKRPLSNKAGKVFALLSFLLAVMIFSGCAHQRFLKVPGMTEVPLPELVAELKRRDIVLVGEVHNRIEHHELQLKVIKALREAGADFAIGLEMFRSEDQAPLDSWVAGEMGEGEFRKAYARNWQVPWPQYRDIFLYAREKKIPLVGLNVSRKIIHKVFKNGFDALGPEELSELPPGLTCDIDQEYEDFIRGAMEEHEMEDSSFKNFCEAQVVWDAGMAKRAIEYLNENPGPKMVILAGGGHSWKRGIPSQIERRSRFTSVVILPEESKKIAFESITEKDADYVWVEEWSLR